MTITTRYGSEVKVIEPMDSQGWVKVKRISDDSDQEYHSSDLRADTQEEFNQVVCGNQT